MFRTLVLGLERGDESIVRLEKGCLDVAQSIAHGKNPCDLGYMWLFRIRIDNWSLGERKRVVT